MSATVLISHPFGNANVRNAALALAEVDSLFGFRTCINWSDDSAVAKILPKRLRQQLGRRTFPSAVSAQTKTRPFREFGRLISTRFEFKKFIAHETGFFSVDAVSQDFDAAVANEIRLSPTIPSAVYAYEDCALKTFTQAKARGVRCIYDLPIGYWQEARAIQSEESELQPEWAGTLTAMIDSAEKLERKDRELEMAEAIYVASSFTASTLAQKIPQPELIRIIPYGCPIPVREPAQSHSGPLRVLFVGSLGQRKGTSYLLSAIKKLGKQVSLTLLGSRPSSSCPPLDEALKTYRWIPSLPHAQVLQEMRNHDVLVFPSLFEGFGLVILEALSQGIPVITTPNTGGPDVLDDGQDGYIVPIRDGDAIAEKLLLLAQNPRHLMAMKMTALKKAEVLTWAKYRTNLTTSVLKFLYD